MKAWGLSVNTESRVTHSFNEESYQRFRKTALELLREQKSVTALQAVDKLLEKVPPRVKTSDMQKYLDLVHAGCVAMRSLIDEANDPFVRDVNGKVQKDDDGKPLTLEPRLVFPITSTGEPAWGRGNVTEGMAFYDARPKVTTEYLRQREAVLSGSVTAHSGKREHAKALGVPILPSPPGQPLFGEKPQS